MDIVTAFASLIRRIIYDETESDEAWLAALVHNGFSTQDITFVYDTIKCVVRDFYNSPSFDFSNYHHD